MSRFSGAVRTSWMNGVRSVGEAVVTIQSIHMSARPRATGSVGHSPPSP